MVKLATSLIFALKGDNAEQEDDFDQDEEVLKLDEGERLFYVLQKVLIAPKRRQLPPVKT